MENILNATQSFISRKLIFSYKNLTSQTLKHKPQGLTALWKTSHRMFVLIGNVNGRPEPRMCIFVYSIIYLLHSRFQPGARVGGGASACTYRFMHAHRAGPMMLDCRTFVK